jgi:hypothetical protein
LVIQSGKIPGEHYEVLGRIEGGWAYEMRLARQDGCWIFTELRVFPDSDDLDLTRLFNNTKIDIAVGTTDAAATSARELAHFALKPRRPEVPVSVPPGGLMTRHLRRIPFGKGSGMDSLQKLDELCVWFTGNHRRKERVARRLANLERRLERELRLDQGDIRLARIASCYADVLNQGSRKPNADVATRLGLKVTEVRDAIFRARQKGLLKSSRRRQRGIAGGELTLRAIALLRPSVSQDRSRKAARRLLSRM